MKNKVLSILFYILSILLLVFYIKNINNNILIRLFILISICIILHIGRMFLIKYNNKYNKISYKVNLIIWFSLYLSFIFKLTLFDLSLNRRGILLVKWNSVIIRDYINYVINLVPFKVITEFIIDFINKTVSFDKLIINILGNLIAFTPFAFFLPELFKKENNIKVFIITMIIIVSIIELSQFITLSGTFDIDDYILNVGGAYFIFKILHKEEIKKLIKKYLYLC